MLDNRSRVYALESWTVEKKRRGWFIKRTNTADQWRGPCGDTSRPGGEGSEDGAEEGGANSHGEGGVHLVEGFRCGERPPVSPRNRCRRPGCRRG